MRSVGRNLKGKLAVGKTASTGQASTPSAGGSSTASSPQPPGSGGAANSQASGIATHNVQSPATIAPVTPVTPVTLAPTTTTTIDLWVAAQQQLSNNERGLLAKIQGITTVTGPVSTQIDDLVRLTREKQEECERKFWRFRIGSREFVLSDIAEKIISFLNTFKQVGDVAVQYDPVAASPAWAGFRFLLQLAVSEREQMAELLLAMERSVRMVARCRAIERLYKVETIGVEALESLHRALVGVYKQILRVLAQSYRLYSKNTPIRSVFALFNPGQATEMSTALARSETDLSFEVDMCENIRGSSADQRLQDEQQHLADLIKKLDEPLVRINDNLQQVLKEIARQQHLELLEWISTVQYAKYHQEIHEARVQNTCEWLLRHDKYKAWMESDTSPVLWIHGSPGTGKTFLASKVIDDLQECLRSPSNPNQEGFAFFYCKRDEEARRNPLEIARSLIRQLSCPFSETGRVHHGLLNLKEELKSRGSALTFGICETWLEKLVGEYPRTTILLDALDECNEGTRGRLLDVLERLVALFSHKLKIVIASRPDADIRDRFKNRPFIEIKATDNDGDIARFVKQEIIKHPRWAKMEQELRELVISTLLSKSRGMFQWAFLQVRQLLDECRTAAAIRNRLGRLPKGLRRAYDDIYSKIEGQNPHDRTLAERALKWVLVAFVPLRTQLLLDAVSQDPERDDVEWCGNPEVDKELILEICCNLLVVDSQLDVWRFSHLSVAEYLEEHRIPTDLAHMDVGKVCLSWLASDHRPSVDERSRKAGPYWSANVVAELPVYCEVYALRHIADPREQRGDSRLVRLLDRFFGQFGRIGPPFRDWDWANKNSRHFAGLLEWDDRYLGRREADALHNGDKRAMIRVVSGLGLSAVLERWAKQSPEEFTSSLLRRDDSLSGRLWEYPLARAAGLGHNGTVDTLMGLCADPSYPCEEEKAAALYLASMNGYFDVVDRLLESGADLNREFKYGVDLIRTGHFKTVLLSAVSRGDIRAVKYLVERGANINLPVRNEYGSALAYAAKNGDVPLIRYLIANGADVNMALEHGWFGSALAAAATAAQVDCVQELLESGADVNQPLPNISRNYGSVLGYMVSLKGYFCEPSKRLCQILKLLLLRGADPNLVSPISGMSALQQLDFNTWQFRRNDIYGRTDEARNMFRLLLTTPVGEWTEEMEKDLEKFWRSEYAAASRQRTRI